MTAINANMSDSQTWAPLAEPEDVSPGLYTIGSENIELQGFHRVITSLFESPFNGRWCVRGVGGSTPASHLSGATLTRYYPDAPAGGGFGGVTVDNTVDEPAEVTSMVIPGATVAASEADLTNIVTILQRTVTLTDAGSSLLGSMPTSFSTRRQASTAGHGIRAVTLGCNSSLLEAPQPKSPATSPRSLMRVLAWQCSPSMPTTTTPTALSSLA